MWRSGLLSLTLHVAGIALLLAVATSPQVHQAARQAVPGFVKLIEPYLAPAVRPLARGEGGGGGGGDRSILPASKGRLPRAAPRQFTPPAAVILVAEPKLAMEPTIVVDSSVPLPKVNMAIFGDPLGVPGPPSNGTGSGGGIGDGIGGGVGPGKGPGYGPGENGGAGGGSNGGRGRFTQATLLWSCEAEYSDDARKAQLQGSVVLLIEVDPNGRVANVRVQRSLGLGLDENAMEAVKKWRFRPGYRDGKPITSAALVEMNFRLL